MLTMQHATQVIEGTNLKLNIGSGSRPKNGYINVDILPLPGVDVVCDLDGGKLPFKDNSVIEICGDHVLEHVKNLVPLMQELYRICAPDAKMHFRFPYYTSETAFKDPTHVRYLNERTFSYFSRKAQKQENLPDYDLNIDFDVLGFGYLYHKRIFALPFMRSFLKRYFWNIVKTMTVSLQAKKPVR